MRCGTIVRMFEYSFGGRVEGRGELGNQDLFPTSVTFV